MSQRKIEMKISATLQPYAECLGGSEGDCGSMWHHSRLAREDAKNHARQTGHQVRIVVEQVSIWGPKDG